MKGVLLALLLPACAWAAPKRVVIIPLNLTDSHYATATAAVQMELQKTEGVPAHVVVVEEAHGKREEIPAIIARARKAGPVDAWVAIGTQAALEVSKAVKDAPVVYGMVYDPVGSGLAASWQSSKNNTTGTGNFVNVTGFMERLVKRGMKLKTVEVLYTPGERNTEIQVEGLAAAEKTAGFKLKRVAINADKDIAAWESGLRGRADLVYLSGSTIVNRQVARLIAAATAAGVPTATHIDDRIEQGCMIGLVVDSAEVGQLTGKALIRVLKGEAPAAIPILAPLPRLAVNKKAAAEAGVTLPQGVLDWAAGRL